MRTSLCLLSAVAAISVTALSASPASAHYCEQPNVVSIDVNCNPVGGPYPCNAWISVLKGAVHRCVSGGAPLSNGGGTSSSECDTTSRLAVDSKCTKFGGGTCQGVWLDVNYSGFCIPTSAEAVALRRAAR
jgi:hypothetical protein